VSNGFVTVNEPSDTVSALDVSAPNAAYEGDVVSVGSLSSTAAHT
jgi:hypothetical protein